MLIVDLIKYDPLSRLESIFAGSFCKVTYVNKFSISLCYVGLDTTLDCRCQFVLTQYEKPRNGHRKSLINTSEVFSSDRKGQIRQNFVTFSLSLLTRH